MLGMAPTELMKNRREKEEEEGEEEKEICDHIICCGHMNTSLFSELSQMDSTYLGTEKNVQKI